MSLVAGISAEVADARGYRRIDTVEEFERAMRDDGFTARWQGNALMVGDGTGPEWGYMKGSFLDHLPGLLIPVWWDGRIVGHDFRFDVAPVGEDGRASKYKWAFSSPTIMDCPPGMQAHLPVTDSFLCITEGVKKADALASIGQPCIALRGVSMWSAARPPGDESPRDLISFWDGVALNGRRVGIIFDSDVATKQQVQSELRQLAQALRARGAIVRSLSIPLWPGVEKAGIDDLLAAGYSLADVADHWHDIPEPLRRPERMRVVCSNAVPLADQVTEAWSAMQKLPDSSLLVHGSQLYRLDGCEMTRHTLASLKVEISRVADFGANNRDGEWASKAIPNDVVTALLDGPPEIQNTGREVDRIVDVPIVGGSGRIITRAGLHPRERIYYVPSIDLANHEIRPWDTFDPDDVDSSKNFLLEDLLGDFAFHGEIGSEEWQANRANTLALLLLPFVRDLIDGPTPLHLAVATTPGTGKGLLIDTALFPALGGLPSATQVPEGANDDEWRKSLLSAMSKGVSALKLDNAPTSIDSRPLASMLTVPIVEGRELGTNRWMRLPVRHVWAMTGNNTELSRELVRRTVLLHLDPGPTVPSERPAQAWRHYPLTLGEWSSANRHMLVAAALTIINHWLMGEARIVNGEFQRESWRRRSTYTLGSFESWSAVMGGILSAAGVNHFMENHHRLRAPVDVIGEENETFLSAWYKQRLGQLSFADLLRACLPGGPLHTHMPTDLVGLDPKSFRHHLMAWVRDNRDVNVGGYALRRAGSKPRNRWSVDHEDDPTPTTSLPPSGTGQSIT